MIKVIIEYFQDCPEQPYLAWIDDNEEYKGTSVAGETIPGVLISLAKSIHVLNDFRNKNPQYKYIKTNK